MFVKRGVQNLRVVDGVVLGSAAVVDPCGSCVVNVVVYQNGRVNRVRHDRGGTRK